MPKTVRFKRAMRASVPGESALYLRAMRPLRAAAALALALGALPGVSSEAASGTYVYVLERAGAVRRLEFTVVASASGNDAGLVVLGTSSRAPRREPAFLTYTPLAMDRVPQVYGTPLPCPCVATPLDGNTMQFSYDVELDGEHPVDRWFVAVRGDRPEIRRGPGVGIRELPGSYFRLVNGNDVATGVQYQNQHWEDFRGASERGGRWGSFAWASLPCDAAGEGDMTLSGGRAPVALGCPEPAMPFGSQWADRATTWRLEGRAVGQTYIRHRLLVLDMPRL